MMSVFVGGRNLGRLGPGPLIDLDGLAVGDGGFLVAETRLGHFFFGLAFAFCLASVPYT